jgi:hypothetical protein
MLSALVVLFVCGLVAAVLNLRFVIGGAPRRVEPNSLLVLDATTLNTVRNPTTERGPSPPTQVRGAGLVWTVDPTNNKLFGTDPVSKHVLRTETVGEQPVASAYGFHAIWVANAGNGSITYVPIGSEKLEAIGLDYVPTGIATGAGYVWVISRPASVVLRIDPKTKVVDKTVRLANPPLAVTAGNGRVRLAIGS